MLLPPSILILAILGPLVAARSSPNRRVVHYPRHSAIFKIATPGCPLYETIFPGMGTHHGPPEYRKHDRASALVFNFTLDLTRDTLLLQNQPFLPFADTSIPPRFRARQIPADMPDHEFDRLVNKGAFDMDPYHYQSIPGGEWSLVDVSYERRVSVPDGQYGYRDEPEKISEVDKIWLDVDILAVRPSRLTPTTKQEEILLDVPKQASMKLRVQTNRERKVVGETTVALKNTFIAEAHIQDRGDDYQPVQPPPADACNMLSWRCADLDKAPWYQYVWYTHFDENGRIGSLRHAIFNFGSDIKYHWYNYGTIYIIVIASVAGFVALLGMLYGLYRLKLRQDEEWRREEEVMLLRRDGDEEDPDEVDAPPSYAVAVASSSTIQPTPQPPIYSEDDLDKPLPSLPDEES